MSDPSADVAHLESDPHTIARGTAATVCKTDDPVNHPQHYTRGNIECIDAIDAAVAFLPADEAVCVANVIKYVWRYRCKTPVESLKKGRVPEEGQVVPGPAHRENGNEVCGRCGRTA